MLLQTLTLNMQVFLIVGLLLVVVVVLTSSNMLIFELKM